jgi:mannose-6-phosphate isomerase-like protein (cupin superfamily)
MIRHFIISLLVTLTLTAQAQDKLSLDSIDFNKEGANIQSIKLFSDSNSTSFVIFVKDQVKAHYHENHTETIVVLEGKAEMQLNNNYLEINVGDILTIEPQNIHSVKVTSEIPLKVLSIQAPEFKGRDRHFEKE